MTDTPKDDFNDGSKSDTAYDKACASLGQALKATAFSSTIDKMKGLKGDRFDVAVSDVTFAPTQSGPVLTQKVSVNCAFVGDEATAPEIMVVTLRENAHGDQEFRFDSEGQAAADSVITAMPARANNAFHQWASGVERVYDIALMKAVEQAGLASKRTADKPKPERR
ncbi:MAG: hypothetical protein H6865_05815 [Rhodospirillales bacterium]|nr:hypothetical protein [Alphaproteobacteria bacterium]MCB9987138.1 hypothetical protein [Rhodospirillales bacterium]USO08105.1 MAG: hypothetical protein H6866_02480 [Rhodospirillales bacterium]